MASFGPMQPSKLGWLRLLLSAVLFGTAALPGSIGEDASKAQASSVQNYKELVRKMLPSLSRACEDQDKELYSALLEYATSVLKPDWIKTDDDLSLFLEKRDSLIRMISDSEPLCEFLSKEADRWVFKHKSGDWEHYDKELGLIGIRTVFAEGMLAGFAEGPILEDVVLRVASEPFQLYITMKEAYARSYGSEYTFMDLGPEMEAIEIGEQLLRSFPESKYAELAKQILAKALFPLTDWHIQLPADTPSKDKDKDHPFCIVGELHTRTFPYWTDIGEPKKFLEAYPGSGFSAVIARIVDDPSEIIIGRSVHVVIVDEFRDEEAARQRILTYLLQGLDIPHLITLSETSYAVAYRFFSDPEKADKALERIKKLKPEARIQVMYPPD